MNNIDRIDGKKFFKPCKEVRTRGHSKRVEKTQCKSLVRRNAFSQRMANDWNALPDAVVMSGSINQFKARLGRWWKNDPILYRNIRSPQVTKHSAIAIYNARGTPALLKPFNGESMLNIRAPCPSPIHRDHGILTSILTRSHWFPLVGCGCTRGPE